VSELATSALTRLEDEIRAALREHEDEIVTAVARVVVGTTLEARNDYVDEHSTSTPPLRPASVWRACTRARARRRSCFLCHK
jgi:hypothetical protein